MAIEYRDTEEYVLTEAQEAAFVSFVTGIWPGTANNIEGASLRRAKDEEGNTIYPFAVRGKMVANTVGELPPTPFVLTDQISGYTYDFQVTQLLSGGTLAAFANFVSQTWTGQTADVERVSFTRTNGGTDILARITGTKTVATPAGLPDPPVTIVSIT